VVLYVCDADGSNAAVVAYFVPSGGQVEIDLTFLGTDDYWTLRSDGDGVHAFGLSTPTVVRQYNG
jgi:hypothetical protein